MRSTPKCLVVALALAALVTGGSTPLLAQSVYSPDVSTVDPHFAVPVRWGISITIFPMTIQEASRELIPRSTTKRGLTVNRHWGDRAARPQTVLSNVLRREKHVRVP
jgi:hypothetical protein